jgi:hypothetical protein
MTVNISHLQDAFVIYPCSLNKRMTIIYSNLVALNREKRQLESQSPCVCRELQKCFKACMLGKYKVKSHAARRVFAYLKLFSLDTAAKVKLFSVSQIIFLSET